MAGMRTLLCYQRGQTVFAVVKGRNIIGYNHFGIPVMWYFGLLPAFLRIFYRF